MSFYLNHNNYRYLYYQTGLTTYNTSKVYRYGWRRIDFIPKSDFSDTRWGFKSNYYTPMLDLKEFNAFNYKYEVTAGNGTSGNLYANLKDPEPREYSIKVRIKNGVYYYDGEYDTKLKSQIINEKQPSILPTIKTYYDDEYGNFSIFDTLERIKSIAYNDIIEKKPGTLHYTTGPDTDTYMTGYLVGMNVEKTDPLGNWADVELTFLDTEGGWVVESKLWDGDFYHLDSYYSPGTYRIPGILSHYPWEYSIWLKPPEDEYTHYYSFATLSTLRLDYKIEFARKKTATSSPLTGCLFVNQKEKIIDWYYNEGNAFEFKNVLNPFEPVTAIQWGGSWLYIKTDCYFNCLTVWQKLPCPPVLR